MKELILFLLCFFIIWRIIYAIMDIWDARSHPIRNNKARQPRIINIKKEHQPLN